MRAFCSGVSARLSASALPVSTDGSGRYTPWFRTTGGAGTTICGFEDAEVLVPFDDLDPASRSAFSTAASPHFLIIALRAVDLCVCALATLYILCIVCASPNDPYTVP